MEHRSVISRALDLAHCSVIERDRHSEQETGQMRARCLDLQKAAR